MAVLLMHSGLESAADRSGDRDAVRAGTDRWSFGALDRLANGYAERLRDEGVAPGGRVAVMMRNRVEFIAAVLGISKAGGAAVLVSPAWKAYEVRHALDLTRPVHAVADGACVELLAQHVPVTDVDVDPPTAGEGFSASAINDTAEAVLVFSSGTTGLPKAVRHTHRSIVAGTRHWVDCLGLGPDDRFQVATPPSHILGLLNLLAAAAAGATVRLHTRFDLDEVLHRIESERMTLEMAVAPIALAMANHPRLEAYDLTSLRFILWGATPVTRSVAEAVTARTGVRWLQGYGASELPVIACNPVDRPDAWRLDSAGLPPAGVELRVADLDTGAILPAGATGEIQARSPSVMAGYLPAEATADAFVDGWYRTGDVGWLDRGRLDPPDRPRQGDDQGQRLPGRACGDRGRPARTSRGRRLRGVRGPRRACRRAAGRRGPAPIRTGRWPTVSSGSSWPIRSPPTSTCARWSSWTPSLGCRRARRYDGNCEMRSCEPAPDQQSAAASSR